MVGSHIRFLDMTITPATLGKPVHTFIMGIIKITSSLRLLLCWNSIIHGAYWYAVNNQGWSFFWHSFSFQISPCFLYILCIYLFYFWLCWVFIAAQASLWLRWAGVTICWSVQASQSGKLSCCQVWALGVQTSVVGTHGFSCSTVCGILLDQGSNLHPLHWQVDSYPLCHQGRPSAFLISILGLYFYLTSSSDLWH